MELPCRRSGRKKQMDSNKQKTFKTNSPTREGRLLKGNNEDSKSVDTKPGPSSSDNKRKGYTNPLDTKPGVSVPSTSKVSATKRGEAQKKSIAPSLKTYRDRRTAYRLITKWANIPEAELSDSQKDSLTWAKNIVKRKESAPNRPAITTKRQRSQEDQEPKSKKAKQSTSPLQLKQYSEALKSQFIWAVIDRSESDGNILPGNWRLVEMALLKVYREVLRENPGPTPECRDAGWYQGRVKLIACSDQRSADLYKIAISKVGEVWKGSRLEAVSKDKIPSRPRSRTWIPAEPSDPKEIAELIQLSNPKLPTQDWKVAKVTEPVGQSRQAIIILNEASVSIIKEKRGVINYGFGSITLRIYDKDAKEAKEKGQEYIPEIPLAMEEDSVSSLEGESYSKLASHMEKLRTDDDSELDVSVDDLNDTIVEASTPSKGLHESGTD